MMFETNTDNNSPRISLARAAQLTGYHQDYLGQLCRLGKLEAVKIGRNWFTSPEALNNLTASVSTAQTLTDEIAEEVAVQIDDEASAIEEQIVSQPIISQNITISEVEGMPIAIRATPTQVRHTNSVQNILTNLRIESLQNEVMELRKLLFRLMEEVKSHTSILQTHETVNRVQDSLKHSYISNFDFSIPDARAQNAQRFANPEERPVEPPRIWHEPKRANYVLVNWVAAGAALIVISFISMGLATSSFLGQEPVTTTLYHRDTPHTQNQPEVAGAASPEVTSKPESLPTDSTGELTPLMVR